jgi:hypothetical protein
MTIPVDDSQYSDILIELPKACQFIEEAISEGGKVLVHCVMGISRSATIICAYCEHSAHPEHSDLDEVGYSNEDGRFEVKRGTRSTHGWLVHLSYCSTRLSYIGITISQGRSLS